MFGTPPKKIYSIWNRALHRQSTNSIIAGLCILCGLFVDNSVFIEHHLFRGPLSKFLPLKTNLKCAPAKQCSTKRQCRLFCFPLSLSLSLFPAQCSPMKKRIVPRSLTVLLFYSRPVHNFDEQRQESSSPLYSWGRIRTLLFTKIGRLLKLRCSSFRSYGILNKQRS